VPLPNEEFGLTPAQWVFALAWLQNGFNGLQAYKTSHPDASDSTAGVEAVRYLKNPSVRTFIAQWLENEWGPLEASAAEAVGRIGAMSRLDVATLVDDDDVLLPVRKWPRAARAAVKEFGDGKVKFVDPLAANRLVLELTGRLKNPLAEMGDALGDAIKRTMNRSE
jgi:hypothetical protein